MAINREDIPQRIKYFRHLRGMTQEELSQAANIHFGQIRKYECGERVPKMEQLEIIADALNISLNTLMDYDIKTAGDVMSLLIKIDEEAGISFSGEKKEDGTYDPSSVKMSFENTDIQQLIADYMLYRENCRKLPDAVLLDRDMYSQIHVEKSQFMLDDHPL